MKKKPANKDSQKSENDNSLTNKKLNLPLSYIIIVLLAVIIILGTFYIVSQTKREAVNIESFTPVDEVPQTTNFTIIFSKNLVGDSLVNVWLDKGHIEFKPSIDGKYQWLTKNKLRFYPDASLAPSTEYIAEISPGIAENYSYALRGNRTFNFSTSKFKVNSASLSFEFFPENDKTSVLHSTIEFNYEVDPEDFVKKTSIRYKDGGQIPFELLTTSINSIIALKADAIKRTKEKKEIQLIIKEGLLPVGGNLGLARDYIRSVIMSQRQKLIV